MATQVNGPALYPLAFCALVLSKVQSVTKSALVPAVIKDKDELVRANSRLALISILGGVAAGPIAAGVLRVGHAPWVLRVAAVVFLFGLAASLRLPRAESVSRPEIDRRARSRCTRRASSPRAARWRCCAASSASSRSSPRSCSRRSTNRRTSTGSC